MFQIYRPPSKWWRRQYNIYFTITLWPKWLAQRLCKHTDLDHTGMRIGGLPGTYDGYTCLDCNKYIKRY